MVDTIEIGTRRVVSANTDMRRNPGMLLDLG